MLEEHTEIHHLLSWTSINGSISALLGHLNSKYPLYWTAASLSVLLTRPDAHQSNQQDILGFQGLLDSQSYFGVPSSQRAALSVGHGDPIPRVPIRVRRVKTSVYLCGKDASLQASSVDYRTTNPVTIQLATCAQWQLRVPQRHLYGQHLTIGWKRLEWAISKSRERTHRTEQRALEDPLP